MTFAAIQSALALLTCVTLLFAPGAVVLRTWLGSWWSALLMAPVVSVLVIALVGGVLRLAHIRPEPLVLIAGVLVLTAAGWIPGAWMGRRSPEHGPRLSVRWATAHVAVISLVVAGASFTTVAVLAMGRLNAWPQMPDNIFHVGAVTWMVRHDTTWLGDVGGYNPLQPGAFPYPGLWHSIVASVAILSGADATTSSNATAIVVGGLVWPASMCVLTRVVLGDSKAVAGLTPLVATSLTGLPFAPMAQGVLWPFLLGCSLVPLALAGCSGWLWGTGDYVSPHWPLFLALLGAATSTLAHPSMFYTLILTSAPLLLLALRRGQGSKQVLLILLFVGPLAFAIRPARLLELNAALPPWGLLQATLALVVIASSPVAIAWWVLMGFASRHARVRATGSWLFFSMFLPLLLGSMVPMLPGWLARSLTWPWWNDDRRLRSVAAIAMCVLIVAGAGALVNRLRAIRSRSYALTAWVAATTMFVVAGLGNLSILRETYAPTSLRPPWATEADRTALATLADRLPIGARVLADPYAGGTQLYLTRDVSLLLPTERTNEFDPDLNLLARRVDDMRNDPRVCRAARSQALGYVVSGGVQSIWLQDRGPEFAGISKVDQSRGFTRVDVEGNYSLWRVPECM